MKWICIAFFAGAAMGQDITFTNQTAVTFTNLEGRVYTNVTLLKATDYGIVWKGECLGMAPYTNLSPAFLKSLGLSTNRILVARLKLELMAKTGHNNATAVRAAAARVVLQRKMDDLEAQLRRSDLNNPSVRAEIPNIEELKQQKAELEAEYQKAAQDLLSANEYYSRNMAAMIKAALEAESREEQPGKAPASN